MSDQDRLRRRALAVAELCRNRQKTSLAFFPSSALVFKAITGQPQPVSSSEPPEEFTSEHYDEWIYQAFTDLVELPQRFKVHPDDRAVIECPRARLLRIGNEAELAGTPSELFRYLMEVTNNGSTLPQVTDRSMQAAQKRLDVAIAFRKFVQTKQTAHKNFKELKHQFRLTCQLTGMDVSESTIERALKAHDINWSAYAIDAPRKRKRRKKIS